MVFINKTVNEYKITQEIVSVQARGVCGGLRGLRNCKKFIYAFPPPRLKIFGILLIISPALYSAQSSAVSTEGCMMHTTGNNTHKDPC